MGIVFISPAAQGRFKNGILPFSNLADLADPFLINRVVHVPEPENQILSAAELEQALRQQYERMPEHMRAMVSWDYYLQQALKNETQIRTQLIRQNAAPPPVLPELKYYARVCCLRVFADVQSPLLWDLHGRGGAGIAVDLNTEGSYFCDKQHAGQPQLWAPIEYSAARPVAPTKDNPFPALLRRPLAYAFEKEWRLIRPLPALAEDGMVGFSFPYELIRAIYFLPRAAEEETRLLNGFSQDLHFRRVPVMRMELDGFDLRFNPRRLC